MTLQRKLLVSFSMFLAVLFVIIGVILFSYGANDIEKSAYKNLEVIGGKMAWQFDNIVRPMDFITVNLIATDNFMRSMSTLANITRGISPNDVYISESMRYIYVTLCNDSINKNFYSVNVFNEKGDLFSSRIQQPVSTDASELIDDMPWLPRVNERKGKVLLIPPHTDTWNQPDGAPVFSLVRSVQGDSGRVGYIETQVLSSELEKIFTIPQAEGLRVLLLTKDNEVFYQSGFSSDAEAAQWIDAGQDKNTMQLSLPAEYSGFQIMLFQDRRTLMQPLSNILRVAALMVLALLVVSLLYALVLTKQFVKPVRDLRGLMEGVELETLQNKLPTVMAGNELVALEQSFNRLRQRLGEAINRELQSQSLQMQANMDVLQSQINPHFLYNILNVLSQKGMDIGDDEICEICADLASMLRYSTSTKQRSATVMDEIIHVKTYVALMKKRYENRLTFSLSLDEAVKDSEMPKIILQQLVENAIKHNFDAGIKAVDICVSCEPLDSGWQILVSDNGCGFDADTLNRLQRQMEDIRQNLLRRRSDFAIGGMGLLNTYARLLLFYGEDCVFVLGNNEPRGAFIKIGVRMRGEKA